MAIVISMGSTDTAEATMAMLCEEKLYTKQDIVFVTREGCIVSFKTFAAECNSNIGLFKHELENYAAELYDVLKNNGEPFCEYIEAFNETFYTCILVTCIAYG